MTIVFSYSIPHSAPYPNILCLSKINNLGALSSIDGGRGHWCITRAGSEPFKGGATHAVLKASDALLFRTKNLEMSDQVREIDGLSNLEYTVQDSESRKLYSYVRVYLKFIHFL